MPETLPTYPDRTYFATQFANVEWVVYTRGRLPFILVDNMGRELDEATARRIAVDKEGTAFNWGQPVEDPSNDLPYSPEELADLARKAGPDVNTIVLTGPDIADDSVDITDIRSRLVAQAAEYSDLRRPFHKAMRKEVRIEDIEGAAALAWEGLAASEAWLKALAFVLRVAEQDAPALAQKLGQITEAVMDAGMEALEDANDDLPEPVATAVAK